MPRIGRISLCQHLAMDSAPWIDRNYCIFTKHIIQDLSRAQTLNAQFTFSPLKGHHCTTTPPPLPPPAGFLANLTDFFH